MGQSERTLTSLGKRVAALQDEAPEARLDRERGRARLLRVEAGGARPRRRAAVATLLAAAALMMAALVLLRPRAPLRFELGGAGAGVVGAWIAAPPGAVMPVRFSDGSELRLLPGGRARVASVSADGADVALERGALEVSVIHRQATRWTVRVGPFQVQVVGTRFEVSWDPVAERFVVALREGAITVAGPVVGEARAVRAGERLTIAPALGTLETTAIDAPAAIDAPRAIDAPAAIAAPPAIDAPTPLPAPLEPPAPPPPPPPPPETGPAPPRSAASAARPAPREAPAWRTLALDGKYREALAAAEHQGFDGLCAASGAADLYALGEAARLGGEPARATQAFTALRARFAGSPEAAAAAFMLGRTAQDRRKDHAGAAGWFARYLAEQPGGAFAAEALGRLVEARDRTGDEEGARRAAERYLAAYPGGSYTLYARRVLARADAGAP
jgi:TolA-binding protein